MGTQYTRIHWPPRYPNQRPQARHLQTVYKNREEEFESQEYPAPTCPSCPLFLFIQTATPAPEKQHWPSAHLSGRKELLNLLVLSHCKESTNLLAKEVIKEKVTSNIWKLQSFLLICQIEDHASFQVWPLHIFPVGSVRHWRKWILVTIA